MEKMYIKFEEDGTYGFYTPEIHGYSIEGDPDYIEISSELYDEAMLYNGVKTINRDLELVESEYIPTPDIKTEGQLIQEATKAFARIVSTPLILKGEIRSSDLAQLVMFYDTFVPDGRIYEVDEIFRLDGLLYKVIQEHTSQLDWLPEVESALYWNIMEDGEIGQWREPQGTVGLYHIGDKVWHNEVLYISIVDNNSWEPGVYGWMEPGDGENIEGPRAWVQPGGTVPAYKIGDEVIFEGVHYISTANGNVWKPGEYGWVIA